MPSKPRIIVKTNTSAEVLNAIRNNASINYRNYVPVATESAESIKEIGAIIMDYPALQNEFLSSLVNRIAAVRLTSKLYYNPWTIFKQGLLEFGETTEEIFVDIAKPFQFDPAVAESELFKREIPDVRSAFHIMNYQKFYKTTVSNDQLRQAFLSINGISNLIAKIVDAMYTGANYDEFLTMKYMLAIHLLRGQLYPEEIKPVTSENMYDITAQIKGISNNLTFLSTNYNITGVHNNSLKEDQFLILNSKFDASMDVNVLATAFNMDKAEFMGKRVLVDSFGTLELDRLKMLLGDNPNYHEFTEAELKALDSIPAVIVDKNFFMIFDNFQSFTEEYNGQGLYWNYFFHTWKTFSVSPFANAIMLIPATPSVTSVSVTPATATATAGSTIQLTAKVTSANFAPQSVMWKSDNENVTVSSAGLVTIPNGVTGIVTIKATSTYDITKFGASKITVS